MDLSTNASELNKSAHKYKKQILQLASIGLSEAQPYMTGMPGVTYKQTVGEIAATSELRPYNGDINAKETAELYERTLETFLGSCVENFDPNQLRQTLWAQLNANAGTISNERFRKAMLFAIMDSVLNKLNDALWSAKRNDSGTTTQDLFDGFDTITDNEISKGNIGTSNNNYKVINDAVDNTNAYDVLKETYRAMSDELKKERTFMFIPYRIYEAYVDDYQTTVGAVPYNREFEKTFLEGSARKCELVPMSSKKDSRFIHISTRSNMLYGYGAGVESENIEVRRGDNPFKLQMILAMFFGTQFATLDAKRLFVAKLEAASS